MQRTSLYRAFVFFWAIGWVCTASALGGEGEPVVKATSQPAVQPAPAEPAIVAEVGGQELPENQQVSANAYQEIDLHVKDLDIAMVLQLLSLESKKNIIATKNVSGTVSADLYAVSFYDALDAVLHANGYGYEERNGFIYVYTAEELQQRIAAQQKPVVRIHRLNYITAADAAQFVTPLLSATGTISVSGAAAPGFAPSVSTGGENAHAGAETLVIRDLDENVTEIVNVLQELDVRPKQVEVAATILEAKLSEQNAFGVDINAIIDFDFATIGEPIGVVDEILDGAVTGETGHAIQTTVGNTAAGSSGVKIGILGSNVSAFIRALDSVTDTTTIAKPTILALNRQRAELLVGERLGYLSTTATETSTTQTVEFLEVGTQLTFRAFISDDDFVRLELRPSISDGQTTFDEGLVIPSETTNTLTTNVLVRSGQTIVLGGLFKESTKVDREQVPGLGDIPLLGYGFRGQDDTVDRSEVIFLITPTVVKDEALYAVGERATDSVEMVRVGAKQGLLPWSRTKQTTSYLHKAVEHHEAGRDDKALWNVNMALTLDPTFVEALRLKEELTGQRLHMHDRSLLKEAVDHMIETRVGAAPAETMESGEQMQMLDAALDDSSVEAAAEPIETELTDGPDVLNVLNGNTPEAQSAEVNPQQ